MMYMFRFIQEEKVQYRSKPVGFVRFKYRKDAMQAIQNLNGLIIRGNKIEVSLTRYGKERGEKADSTCGAGE